MAITTSYFSANATVANPPPQTPAAPGSEHVERAEALLTEAEATPANIAPQSAQNASTLPGARAELQTVTRQLDQASADLAVAQQPISRLQRIVADADLSQRDLDAAQSAERDILAAWLASDMQGPRPQPSRALIEAERRVVEAARDAAAARSALPDHQAAAQRAAEHANAISRHRSEVHKAAIIEAVSEFVSGPFTDALRVFRGCECRVAAIEAHFQQTGDFTMVEQIRAIAAKACKAVPDMGGDARAGAMIVARLLANPAGNL